MYFIIEMSYNTYNSVIVSVYVKFWNKYTVHLFHKGNQSQAELCIYCENWGKNVSNGVI